MPTLGWQENGTEPLISNALDALSNHYPIKKAGRPDFAIEFKNIISDNRICRINTNGKKALLEYSDLTSALRGIGRLLSGKTSAKTLMEQTNFRTVGIMLDCSRNAVIKPEHFKGWLRKLSLLGFNMAMLYTEDTYELPNEPYFGYQRGRYTVEELKEIDNYAARLGIEMIGCIQTLGHCEQILKWTAYNKIKDTSQILLVGEKKTYELIEKMIANFAHNFRSRRIHIGMDEAQELGRGKYMDLNGPRPRSEIFIEHLNKVAGICRKHGLEPLIWSDMFFAMSSKEGGYYDKACKIPNSIKAKIPKSVQLVYWDYYHRQKNFYSEWINRHRGLGREPVMASGIWTWHSFWYDRLLTEQNAGACVQACKNAGLKEIFFTMWGDDGAYCNFDSALAGLAYVSELIYSNKVSTKILKDRFSVICGGDYDAICTASGLNMHGDINLVGEAVGHTNSAFFWDDPLLGIFYCNKAAQQPNYWPKMRRHYKKLIPALAKRANGDDLKHALLLCRILQQKIDIRAELEKAYRSRHNGALKNVRNKIPALIKLLIQFDKSFRHLWLQRNKPEGLEVIQIRFAGMIRRYQEMHQRLDELIKGKIINIDELERPAVQAVKISMTYRDNATGSRIL